MLSVAARFGRADLHAGKVGGSVILFPEFHARYGPWAIVAGASEGIGQAYAHVLAERGLNLVTLARRAEPLEADAQLIRRRHRVEVRCVSLDLAAPDLGERFEAAIAGLDAGLLVYNACYSRIAEFVDAGMRDHQATLDVNCRGPVILAHRIAPRLIERGRGGILLMSSMSGFQGSALISTYAASKAFNVVLAESLWAELAPHGVDALACVAGATLTPNFKSITPERKQPKAFPMRPEAVAREGLDALGKGPVHVAGGLNRLVDRFSRLMTRRQRTRFFSKATRDIYGSTENPQ
jgi:short-subunit dehydrogenase